MVIPRRTCLLVGVLLLVLSACATTPGPATQQGPAVVPLEAETAVRDRVPPAQSAQEARVLAGIEAAGDPLRDSARRYQEEAVRLEAEGRLREALERWKVVLTIDPQDPKARQKQEGLETKIREQFQQHIAAGKDRLQRRDKQGAEREFLAALRLDPLNREALEQLYQSDEQLGEQTAFARPLPTPKSATPARGERGRTSEAKPPPAEEMAEHEETGEEVTLAEAAEIFRRGDYLAAIDAFTRVLAVQPGMREAIEYQKLAYYNQGMAYVEGENYGEALRMFEQVQKMQPGFKRVAFYIQTTHEKMAEQHNLVGIRYFREKKLKEAIEEWDQALVLNPKLDSAKRSKERAVRLLKNLEEVK